MNSPASLFRKLDAETEAGKLEWKLVPRRAYSELIFQPNHVFRIFQTTFVKDDDQYTVLLVEKKYDDPDWDFDVEKYKPEIYFIYDDSIVLTIDEDTVDLNKIISLVRTVELSTDRAKRLLG